MWHPRPDDRIGPRFMRRFSYQGEPIMVTEYGGIAYDVGEKDWGYSSVSSSEELAEEYRKQTEALFNPQCSKASAIPN